ncbi:hypothetical protein CIHG_07471 [Coccidioides immitis H538.4]|uniref:Uncharacterized protein n=2 Tax=Coccidioides immitis TaxID=5501 RepID=A0A0J8RZX1_COCIT|nr:hypothetical protein CIRG_02391 [Coccidioides immitis RMSCC 2394]KMU89664.1 hypothetical protein CIHG_07471 [Coccidioides immitis H538.4]
MSHMAARLEFLKKSALMLASDSPSTSAHLLAAHNCVLYELSKPMSFSQKREYCPSFSTRARAPKGARRGRMPPTNDKESCAVYNCLRCHRQTVQPFKKAKPNRPGGRIAADTSALNSLQPTSQTETSAPELNVAATLSSAKMKSSSDNASSKKRAKARKQQGLLAALAASKQTSQPSPSTSLDLLDFLQP